VWDSMQDRMAGLTRRHVVSTVSDGEGATPRKRMTQVFRALDANPKLKEDYTSESTSGIITTLVCGVFCLLLFLGEFYSYTTSSVVSQLRVNPLGVDRHVPNSERLKIDIDITFHSLPCNLITLDTSDKAGEQHFDVHDGHVKKRRLDRHGKVLDNQYSSEVPNKHKNMVEVIQHLNKTGESEQTGDKPSSAVQQRASKPGSVFGSSVEDMLLKLFPDGVESAFRNEAREGCEVKGYLEVNRVPGSFSISPGRTLTMGMQMIKLNIRTDLNLTHTIHRLSFGESFPGFVSPLDGTHRSLPPNAVHQYFLNVVSTTFEPLKSQRNISTHQYSVTESFSTSQRSTVGGSREPGVVFTYEISPIRVDFKETRSSFGSFMIGICSIIGGVVTMAGLIRQIVEYVIQHHGSVLVEMKR